MKNNVLAFPKKTIFKRSNLKPGEMMVRLDLKVSATTALLIIALIDGPVPALVANAGVAG